MPTLDQLNTKQREAVAWGDGPCLVLAGPGSGKTAVLTLRVARILESDPDATVLALTFTNKAATEMRERVDLLLGERADRARLCTFHTFAGEILRQHGSHVGIRPDFTLLTLPEDRAEVVRRILVEDRNRTFPERLDPQSLLDLLDRLFRESYDGGPELDVDGLTDPPAWLPVLFERYCKLAVVENRVDFGVLLHLAHRVLSERPQVARLLRKTWSHFCVDEFQDTNRAQYDLLRLLVGEGRPNLFVVADDDQIIYQWNGASPERLRWLRDDYEMEVVQLPENYRCPPEIIELANALIQHNRQRSEGKEPLVAHQPPVGGDVIRLGKYGDEDHEVAAVASDIRRRSLTPKQCVVLARTTRQLLRAANALTAAGIEAYVVQRKDEFVEAPVALAYNLLRLAAARHDRDVLRRVCVAWKKLSRQTIEVEDVEAAATLAGGDFLRTWLSAATAQNPVEPLASFLGQVESRLLDRVSPLPFVDWFLKDGWQAWKGEEDQAVEDEISAWLDLHHAITGEYDESGLTLHAYVQNADAQSKATPPGENAVRCMTIHGAKGLEFHHVYLIGMAEDVCPSWFASKQGPHSREMEEERRNCFVAITRVQQTLTITYASSYNNWSKRPSRFLLEMGLVES